MCLWDEAKRRSNLKKHGLDFKDAYEVIEHFKSGGPGWQTRIDTALRESIRKRE